jgi:MFS family permease
VALDAAVAAAGPVVASLVGDLFTPTDRARAYSRILTGELAGAGIGLLVGGDIAAALSWRYAFLLLAAASLGLAVVPRRSLPEPARGGASWVPAGANHIPLPDNDQGADRDDDVDASAPSGSTVKALVRYWSPCRCTRRRPPRSPRPTRPWTRPGWTSCRRVCGVALRACEPCCAWPPRPSPRACSDS